MLVFGDGGHSKMIQDMLEMDDVCVEEQVYHHLDQCKLNHLEDTYQQYVIGIGDNLVREMAAEKIAALRPNLTPGVVVSARAIVSKTACIGPGSVVCDGAIIRNGVRIGDHCIVNSGSVIDHDCTVEDFCSIGPGAVLCGGVHLLNGVLVGAGACVKEGLAIEKGSLLGMGSVVLQNVPAGEVWAGVPARFLKSKSK